jgi:ribose/xylose/arabinose/galactoside ABC-type transport system permease subunit
VLGGVNGLLVSRLRANSLITTLAMGLLLTGAVLAITKGETVTVESSSYLALGSTRVGGWPVLPLLLLAAHLFAAVLFNHTAWGRSLYATGGNRRAAHAAGIDVKRVRTTAFMLSGLFAGAAGVALTSYLAGVSSNTGSNLLMYAIAAPVIGGVSLIGGRGRVLGVLGGTLLLTVVQLGLQVVNISAYYVQMVGGGMILLAVIIDALRVRSESPEK